MIPNEIRAKIERAAEVTYGWGPGEIEVDELNGIHLPPWVFYSVRPALVPVPEPVSCAVFPDGRLVRAEEEGAAAAILDAATDRNQASADDWAELISRFYSGLGPGSVVYQRVLAESQVRQLEAAGRSFEPPILATEPDGVRVRFCMNTPWSLVQVTAKRFDDGRLEVETFKVP